MLIAKNGRFGYQKDNANKYDICRDHILFRSAARSRLALRRLLWEMSGNKVVMRNHDRSPPRGARTVFIAIADLVQPALW